MSQWIEQEDDPYIELVAAYRVVSPLIEDSCLRKCAGYFFPWRSSNLEPQERATMPSMIRGDWKRENVVRVLRDGWADSDQLVRDNAKRRSSAKTGAIKSFCAEEARSEDGWENLSGTYAQAFKEETCEEAAVWA